MRVKHRENVPQIDPTAWIAPNAVVSGRVVVGPRSRILYGAVLTAEGRAELRVGRDCVIMEQAVLRASGRFSLTVGDSTLIGPHAYLSGCTIGPSCFIATGAMVFNGSSLGEGSTVALGGIVHIGTTMPRDSWIPIGHIAVGHPGEVFSPDQSTAIHEKIGRTGFPTYVFGLQSEGRHRGEINREIACQYSRALQAHQHDEILSDD
ncbi:MAG: transferase [Sulfobacillus benefaciens]|uniref:Transferase n=1 Tax=Sulfobacillus benefaciens TaxID=453960 RepID=A0A2T2X7Z2_9FIRM|nr:MAG: transferase [Sulfobacillus benefaciens]